MLILEALLWSIASAVLSTAIFGDYAVGVVKPIINGFISFVTKVPVTEDQAKAFVFTMFFLLTLVPMLNRISRKKVSKPLQEPKEKRKRNQEAEFRLTDDGELEEVVEDL